MLEPIKGQPYPTVRDGKTENAKRSILLTSAALGILKDRQVQADGDLVLPARIGAPYVVRSIDHLQQKVRQALDLPKDLVFTRYATRV